MSQSLITSRMRARPKGLASGAGRHSGAALSAPIFSAAASSTVLFVNLRAQRAQRAASQHLNQASLWTSRRSEKERLLFHWARRVQKRGLVRVSEGERVQARPRRPRRASHEQRLCQCRSGAPECRRGRQLPKVSGDRLTIPGASASA